VSFTAYFLEMIDDCKEEEGGPITEATEAIYDLLTALRGPDVNDSDEDGHEVGDAYRELKKQLTGRLRYIVFDELFDGPIVTGTKVDARAKGNILEACRVLARVQNEHREARGDGLPGLRHFTTHLREAIRSTEEHWIWDGEARVLIDWLRRCANGEQWAR